MSEDEEKDYYERYVKSENTLRKRLKRWFSPKKVIQTIHDVDYFDWDMVVKLFCIILLCMVISQIGGMIADIWFWFFPQAQTKGGEWGYFMPALMMGFLGVNQVPGQSYALVFPPRKCECRSDNTTPGSLTETWDDYYRKWKCEDCGNTWLVGAKKSPPWKPIEVFA